MVAELLSRHKHAFHWLHIIAVLGSLCVAIPAIAWSAPFSPLRALLVFAIALVAWCQNIGLIHEGAHRLPRGPRWLGLWIVRFLHALGGLRFTATRFAHLLHHAGPPWVPGEVGGLGRGRRRWISTTSPTGVLMDHRLAASPPHA